MFSRAVYDCYVDQYDPDSDMNNQLLVRVIFRHGQCVLDSDRHGGCAAVLREAPSPRGVHGGDGYRGRGVLLAAPHSSSHGRVRLEGSLSRHRFVLFEFDNSHWTRREKRSKLGPANPVATTVLYTLHAQQQVMQHGTWLHLLTSLLVSCPVWMGPYSSNVCIFQGGGESGLKP